MPARRLGHRNNPTLLLILRQQSIPGLLKQKRKQYKTERTRPVVVNRKTMLTWFGQAVLGFKSRLVKQRA
jgi:hypothetical protein